MEIGVSLGSNLGDRLANLRRARGELERLPGATVTACSPVYETEPVGVSPQYAAFLFLNAVIVAESGLPPEEFLAALRDIEERLGRARSAGRNAPRAVDLDIIYAGQLALRRTGIEIPHPRWADRRFVVRPLADVRPDLRLPGRTRTVKEILLSLPNEPKVSMFTATW